MNVTIQQYLYGFWLFVGWFTALVLVGFALLLGLAGKRTMLEWRAIKVASSLSGMIGLAFLLMTLEGPIRVAIKANSARTQFLEYVNARADLMRTMVE